MRQVASGPRRICVFTRRRREYLNRDNDCRNHVRPVPFSAWVILEFLNASRL